MNHEGRQFRLAGLALATITVMTSLWAPVSSHGRLWTPPGRATMWKKGFRTPVNYDDNAMFCGGLQYQLSVGYKCGICGDPYESNRPSEAGGRFATGTIAATYKQAQEVTLQVQITANHKGWFEFKICPTNDYKKKATQKCLDAYPLQLSDGSGTKLYVAKYGNSMVTIPVKLPEDLTCEFCVLQWRYHTGNSWGVSKGGRGCIGCGYQEEFYGCADIKIEPAIRRHDIGKPSAPTVGSSSTLKPTSEWSKKTTVAPRTTPAPKKHPLPAGAYPRMQKCKAQFEDVPGLLEWCYNTCSARYCPERYCKCS